MPESLLFQPLDSAESSAPSRQSAWPMPPTMQRNRDESAARARPTFHQPSPTLAKLMFSSGRDRCSHATFVVACSDRKAYLRSCMGVCFNHMTYLNWPFTLLPGTGHRSRAGRSCLATGISHRYTEKSDRRSDIARNRYRFSPPGWWLGTPRCRIYRSLWIYLTI